MTRSRRPGKSVLALIALQTCVVGELRGQAAQANGHEHLTEVGCVDVVRGEKRPEFGCFNVGKATGLRFPASPIYWHLRTFASRKAAEDAKGPNGIVVEEHGRVWLSEVGPQDAAPRGGAAAATAGPLQLSQAESYSVVLSYAVMRPGDSSTVHTHPGPEAWFVLEGEQCLETPLGASKAVAGRTMTVEPSVPMELYVTGATVRRAFALVIHDSVQPRSAPSDWKPSGACAADHGDVDG